VTTVTDEHDELPDEVESFRLLANEAREELGAAGYSDQRIDELADTFIADNVGQGAGEFVRWASLQGPVPTGEWPF
jgi:hypothetical protein